MNAAVAPETNALLYLDGVTVSFDGFKALNTLSFVVEPGEMRAVIGPNVKCMQSMLFITTAVGTLPGAIGSGISTGIWESLLATPARVPALLGGLTAYELLWTLARAGVLLAAAWLLGARIAWDGALLSLGVLALIVLAYLPVGVLTAAFVIAFRSATPLPRVVLVASALLGGVYYPTTVIPGWIQGISAWIPLTYGVRALRRTLLEGWTLVQVLPDLEMLVLFDAVLLVAASAAFAAALRYARRAGTLAQY